MRAGDRPARISAPLSLRSGPLFTYAVSGQGEDRMSDTPEHHLVWERSSFCSDSACVEVAESGDLIFVRNNQQPDSVVRFTRREWEVFVQGVVAGDFV
jgi:predicted secreted Zn-dependent protease